MTAAELAEALQASPAAVSGAVRYLVQTDLVERAREPGSRRDVYRLGDDPWYEAIYRREPLLERWERALAGRGRRGRPGHPRRARASSDSAIVLRVPAAGAAGNCWRAGASSPTYSHLATYEAVNSTGGSDD